MLPAGPVVPPTSPPSYAEFSKSIAALSAGVGVIWSPNHGDTAFTVPLFDEFMHRAMPGDGWRT
jgi:hypothetical protein